ncbi:MAG: hypothetical protein ACD_72C00409G0002 [uncultured bacterium]|nr:MAG: hypothetical protein ACD_72C00409G0002 [uncultured bacterium]
MSTLDEEEKEPSESWEDLRDNEFEQNLDEYGDGNSEAAWPDAKEEKDPDEELDDEADDTEI